LTFDLVREIVHVPSVTSRTLDGGVGYIRLKQFQEHTHDELLRAAGKLRSDNPELSGIVLDLRNNPGGLVDESAEIADEFLDQGTIYTTRHRGQIVDEVNAKAGGAFVRVPMVVLVNEYSASAAELLAGALQDQKRARIVGSNTFGKGSVQTILDLPGGAGMRLTTARYYTPGGHSVQAEGIHPDLVVELNRDPAMTGLPSLHERDLEGHLSAETHEDTRISPRPTYKEPAETSGTATPPREKGSDGERARNIPKDPTTGSDFALKIAYEALRGTLPPPPPPSRP
jgi:carboxyl-terminal processing protease